VAAEERPVSALPLDWHRRCCSQHSYVAVLKKWKGAWEPYPDRFHFLGHAVAGEGNVVVGVMGVSAEFPVLPLTGSARHGLDR